MLTGHGNYMADCARRECAKELEELLASTDKSEPPRERNGD